jgi:hypothetical protein
MINNCGNSFGIYADIDNTKLHRIIKQINWVKENSKDKKSVANTESVDETIVLDKDSERTAVMSAVLNLGYDLSDEDSSKVYDEFKRAVEKKNVGYKELDAIVASVALQVPATYKLISYVVNTGNIISSSAQVAFEKDGKTVENGFCGGLLGHWSIWTAKVVEMFHMLRNAAPTPELLTLAAQVTDCNSAFFDTAHNFRGCIAGMHEVLRRQGLIESICCLNPEETLSPGQAEEIDRVYAAYPHLNDDAFVREYLSRHVKS